MTKRQRRDHKVMNQFRKIQILRDGMQFYLGGVIQNGKFTDVFRSTLRMVKS